MKNLRHTLQFIRYWPLGLLLLLASCSEPDSPEQQIRNYIDSAILAAESRKPGDFMDLIDDTYQDSHGNNKKMLGRMALGYLMANRNINVFTRIDSIYFSQPDQANVVLFAGMTGRPVEDISSFINIRADLFKFELKLIRDDGDWLLNNARWQRVRAQDLN